jgi:hypothetical protein
MDVYEASRKSAQAGVCLCHLRQSGLAVSITFSEAASAMLWIRKDG